jgi:hypothetical protein
MEVEASLWRPLLQKKDGVDVAINALPLFIATELLQQLVR